MADFYPPSQELPVCVTLTVTRLASEDGNVAHHAYYIYLPQEKLQVHGSALPPLKRNRKAECRQRRCECWLQKLDKVMSITECCFAKICNSTEEHEPCQARISTTESGTDGDRVNAQPTLSSARLISLVCPINTTKPALSYVRPTLLVCQSMNLKPMLSNTRLTN